jgi:hypothetical protein
MITYETLIRKLSQKKQRRKFMHKTKYGKELGEQWGYDMKGHIEEYKRLKNDPDQMYREYFKF